MSIFPVSVTLINERLCSVRLNQGFDLDQELAMGICDQALM